MKNRRSILGALAALATTSIVRAQAAFPERTVKLVVPNPTGGPSDTIARYLAEAMRSELGQSVIIENRPGAAGLIGTAVVANSPADGHTVLVTNRSNHVIAPIVQRAPAADPVRDLVPIGMAIRAVGIVATHPKAPFKSLREMVAYAKKNPGKLFYGSAGIGAANHIAVEQFRRLAGIEVTHVPYKGSGPLITGLMAGEVAFAFLDFSSALTGLQGATLVPLVQTASRRLPALAHVPTFREAGFNDFDSSFWIGLAVPKGTPAPAIAGLNKALNVALAETQMKARAQVNGWELVGGSPRVLGDVIAAEVSEYRPLLAQMGIKGE